MLFIAYNENTATYSHRMKPKHLSPLATYCPITGPSPHMRQLHMASTAAQTAGSLSQTSTHSGLFHSWN
jgi:hypothetical protein